MLILLDMGHGGINPVTKKYTTAPAKQFDHPGHTFHIGSMFCEGVKNREYGYLLAKALKEAGHEVIICMDPVKDTPLETRVNIANNYYRNHKQPAIFISEHSNATITHTAKGFSVWTTKGQTKSDTYAEILLKMYKEKFPNIKIISQPQDGDLDCEENFYVIKNTVMPAVLIENLFFDNLSDAKLLQSAQYRDEYIKLIVAWINKISAEFN